MTRIGLVGFGGWGKRLAANLQRRTDFRLVAVARASGRREGLAPDLSVFADWRALLELGGRGELDALVVATEPSLHPAVAGAALAAGLPMLVEKPLALTAGEIEPLLASVTQRRAPPPLLVDYVHRWAPAYRAIKARVAAQGGPGRSIAAIASQGQNAGPFRAWSALHDYGAHDLSLCLDLLDGAALQVERASRHGGEQGAIWQVELRAGDVPVRIEVGNGGREKVRRLSVNLTGASTLVYDDLREHPLKLTCDGTPVPVDPRPPLDCVLDELARRIARWRLGDEDGEETRGELQLSLAIARLLDQIAARCR